MLAAAKHHINGFISKPLDVEMVHDRRKQLLPVTEAVSFGLEGLEKLFADAMVGQILLPTSLDPADVLSLMHRDDSLFVSQLAERWRNDKSLVTRLLDVVNGRYYRRSGEPVTSLRDAIHTLGVKMPLNLGLSLALDHAHDRSDERLRARARTFGDLSDRLAIEAGRMARQLRPDRHDPQTL